MSTGKQIATHVQTHLNTYKLQTTQLAVYELDAFIPIFVGYFDETLLASEEAKQVHETTIWPRVVPLRELGVFLRDHKYSVSFVVYVSYDVDDHETGGHYVACKFQPLDSTLVIVDSIAGKGHQDQINTQLNNLYSTKLISTGVQTRLAQTCDSAVNGCGMFALLHTFAVSQIPDAAQVKSFATQIGCSDIIEMRLRLYHDARDKRGDREVVSSSGLQLMYTHLRRYLEMEDPLKIARLHLAAIDKNYKEIETILNPENNQEGSRSLVYFKSDPMRTKQPYTSYFANDDRFEEYMQEVCDIILGKSKPKPKSPVTPIVIDLDVDDEVKTSVPLTISPLLPPKKKKKQNAPSIEFIYGVDPYIYVAQTFATGTNIPLSLDDTVSGEKVELKLKTKSADRKLRTATSLDPNAQIIVYVWIDPKTKIKKYGLENVEYSQIVNVVIR